MVIGFLEDSNYAELSVLIWSFKKFQIDFLILLIKIKGERKYLRWSKFLYYF